MTGDRIYLYDTTLRDGAQTQDVDFSVADKIAISQALDDIGIDYVEGGWPGANPTDDQFFAKDPGFKRAIFSAFGMTRRPGRSAANDTGLAGLFNSRAQAVCLVGKTWDFHVQIALGATLEENLDIIADSVAASKAAKGEALFDAEHFFDSYLGTQRRPGDGGRPGNPQYAVACLKAALNAGARWLVLCDTNGGRLPHEIEETVKAVVAAGIPGEKLGIHCHNDTENAVANSLAAVRGGARMVQGTVNGLGERCGNANLVAVIPSLMLKMGFATGIAIEDLPRLTQLSRMLDDRLNRTPNRHAAYVGASAFAHKGGLHVSAVEKDPTSYEHVRPEQVGNRRQIVMSDQAGRSNVVARVRDMGLDIDSADPRLTKLVETVKQRDMEGYAYDTAEASFELLVRRELGLVSPFFAINRFHVTDERRYNARGELVVESEAVVRMIVGADSYHEVATGEGPVSAMSHAMLKALRQSYPSLEKLRLVDYQVRILAAHKATEANPRVVITCEDESGRRWRTLGVSASIIAASVEALADSYSYKLMRDQVTPPSQMVWAAE